MLHFEINNDNMVKRGKAMKHESKLLFIAGLLLSACTSGNDSGEINLGGINSDPIEISDMGQIDDPTSPLYFQEVLGDRVFFDVDLSSLSAEAKSTLDGQAEWLNANPEFSAIIEGHTDEQGTTEYNLALGARRANSVFEYLVSQGVDGPRIRVVSFGKERPFEVCSAEMCYAQNRRAVTVISAIPAG